MGAESSARPTQRRVGNLLLGAPPPPPTVLGKVVILFATGLYYIEGVGFARGNGVGIEEIPRREAYSELHEIYWSEDKFGRKALAKGPRRYRGNDG